MQTWSNMQNNLAPSIVGIQQPAHLQRRCRSVFKAKVLWLDVSVHQT